MHIYNIYIYTHTYVDFSVKKNSSYPLFFALVVFMPVNALEKK